MKFSLSSAPLRRLEQMTGIKKNLGAWQGGIISKQPHFLGSSAFLL